MEKEKKKYTYCIFYLEKKLYKRINEQLLEEGYTSIKAIVPTINILRKTIKGKMIFEQIPVLFNYGFIKMPTECAFSRPFLNKMKKKIPGIHHWLKNTETMHPRKKRARIDNAEDFDDFSLVATVPRSEVRRFQRIARANKKYSLDDLVNLKPGDYVSLTGYPYEGVGAMVTEVNLNERKVHLEMTVREGTMPLVLPFDNVLYSVYQNYDEDKLYAGFLDKDPENVTQESIDEILERKIY